MQKFFQFIIAGFLIGFICSVLLLVPARGHQPAGWEYDKECCSGQDCNVAKKVVSLSDGKLRITVDLPVPGTHMKEFSEHIVDVDLATMDRKKIRASKDENIHICLFTFEYPAVPLCIYLPAGS